MGAAALGAEAQLTPHLPAAAAQGWECCGSVSTPTHERLTPSLSLSVPAYQMGSESAGGRFPAPFVTVMGKQLLPSLPRDFCTSALPRALFEGAGEAPRARRSCSSPISPESMGWSPGSHWCTWDSYPKHPPSQAGPEGRASLGQRPPPPKAQVPQPLPPLT